MKKKSREKLVAEMHRRKVPKYPELGIAGYYKEYWECYFDSKDYQNEKEVVNKFLLPLTKRSNEQN